MEKDYKVLKELKDWLKERQGYYTERSENTILSSEKHGYNLMLGVVEEIQEKITSIEENYGKVTKNHMLREIQLAADVARQAGKPTIKLRYFANGHWGSMHVPVDRAVRQANRWFEEDGVETIKAI
jgi:hypothetical protein